MKRAISVLIVMTMIISVFTMIPISVSAGVTNVESSGASGILDASGFYYELLDDGTASIIGYTGYDTSLNIPSEINGRAVTAIGYSAFYYDSSLTSVTIPVSVTSIGSYAFYSCTKLNSVNIPGSVKTIGGWAFYNCANLTSVTIPDSVKSIGGYAFYACSKLNSITFPDSVMDIGSYAFLGNAWYNNRPDGIVYVGKVAYKMKGNSLSTVTVKDGTVVIADNAFYGCKSILAVTIPESVTTIGAGAFGECNKLEAVNIRDIGAWCSIDFGDNPLSTAHILYINGKKVTDLVIPDFVKTISKYAFKGCSGLTSVTIPDSVTSIGESAFYGCGGMISVTIPKSVKTIGETAFYKCVSLESVTIPDSVEEISRCAFLECGGLRSVTIPKSVKTIGESAFNKCVGLTKVTIPDSVTTIGDGAFYKCGSLTSVTIPKSVTTIGASAFSGCESLTKVTIPDSVKTIGKSAFVDCTQWTRIIIPASVTKIGSQAFGYKHQDSDSNSEIIENPECKLIVFSGSAGERYAKTNKLSYYYMPCDPDEYLYSVDGGGNACIAEYSGKASKISIPSKIEGHTVTAIGEKAFSGCGGLRSVIIPKSVRAIGAKAFSGCSGLTSLRILNAQCDIFDSYGALGDRSKTVVCGYPGSAAQTYCKKYGYTFLLPPEPKASNNADTGKITLKWKAVTGAKSYRVYRADSKDGKYKLIKTITAKAFTDTTAKAEKTYYYKVVSVGKTSDSYSIHSKAVSCTYRLKTPVVTVSNNAETGKITLKWKAVTCAKGYRVYRAESKGGKYKAMKVTKSATYTNTSAKAGKKYYYKVVALGSTAKSNSAESKITSRTCDLSRPVVRVKNNSAGHPRLSWKAVGKQSGYNGMITYEIYRSTSKNSGYKLLGITSNIHFTNASAKAGKTYYYKVKAVLSNASANSAYSSAVSVKAK